MMNVDELIEMHLKVIDDAYDKIVKGINRNSCSYKITSEAYKIAKIRYDEAHKEAEAAAEVVEEVKEEQKTETTEAVAEKTATSKDTTSKNTSTIKATDVFKDKK